jgi:hypothetical protein
MDMAEHLTLASWPLSDTVKEMTGALEGAYKKGYGPKEPEEPEFTTELPPAAISLLPISCWASCCRQPAV